MNACSQNRLRTATPSRLTFRRRPQAYNVSGRTPGSVPHRRMPGRPDPHLSRRRAQGIRNVATPGKKTPSPVLRRRLSTRLFDLGRSCAHLETCWPPCPLGGTSDLYSRGGEVAQHCVNGFKRRAELGIAAWLNGTPLWA